MIPLFIVLGIFLIISYLLMGTYVLGRETAGRRTYRTSKRDTAPMDSTVVLCWALIYLYRGATRTVKGISGPVHAIYNAGMQREIRNK